MTQNGNVSKLRAETSTNKAYQKGRYDGIMYRPMKLNILTDWRRIIALLTVNDETRELKTISLIRAR